MRRLVLLVVLAVAAVGGTPARAASAPDEARMVALTNAERGAGLRVAADLVAFARHHSDRMAAGDRLYHSPDLATVGGWVLVGENVGRGSSVEHVHQMLMDSPSHRRTLLDARYTEIGVGVTWDGPTVYVTEIFRQPTRPAAAPVVRRARPVRMPTTTVPPPPVVLPGRVLAAVVLSSTEVQALAVPVAAPAVITAPTPSRAGPVAVAAGLVGVLLLAHLFAARRRAAVR